MDQPTNTQLLDQLAQGSGTFAAKIAEISTAAMTADHQGQMQHLAYVQGVMNLPNIVMEQAEDIGFGLGTITRHDERAAITAVKVDRLGINEVDMQFSMTVGSHTDASKETGGSVKSDTEISGGGKFLWMHASFKQSISAEVRHSSKQTRSTDMSSSVEIGAKLTRQESPEGLSKMIDCANEFSRRVNDLRMKIAEAKVSKIATQIEENEIDPWTLSEPSESQAA